MLHWPSILAGLLALAAAPNLFRHADGASVRAVIGMSLATLLPFLPGCAAPQPPLQITGGPQQVQFSCPAAGTKTRQETKSSVVHEEWGGADTSDPFVCIRQVKDRERQLALFAIQVFPLKAGQEEIRAAYAEAFAGSPEQKCARVQTLAAAPPSTNPGYVYVDCIQQLGTTQLSSGGKLRQVVVFRTTEVGERPNTYEAESLRFYDPETHIFVKRTSRTFSGNVSADFERLIEGD